jgi:predicted DNA-binding transcriptional regulator YafY
VESAAARLLELLSLLQSKPHWNAPELSDRLGVTPRTVRRDVTRLRDLGYPVLADPGATGGYQLGSGAALPPLLLTDDEAVAVAVGLRTAAAAGPAGYEQAAVAALAKLEQVLPARLRDRVLALNAVTVLVPHGPDPATDPELLLTLAQGCRRPERMRLDYRDGSGTATERRIEPYGLVHASRHWYLVAFDLDRDDWRTFRVDRIGAATLTGHRFTRTSEPDTAAMVLDGIVHAPYAVQAEILLHAPIEQVRQEVSSVVGTLEATADGTVLRLGANELSWIARYLAGLPFEATVIDPPELRAALRSLGARLQRSHR